MDYPGPRVEITPENQLDLSNAYAKGIGAWDKVSIAWGYSEFKPLIDEHAALNDIVLSAAKRGLTFITDADSRPLGSAHPKSHLWDNGPNAVDELQRVLKVRSIALARFGENSIPVGTPLATLDEVLAPLYFSHRYQTEAAAKVLGGNEYTYALRGDGQTPTRIVAPEEQRRALHALIETIEPKTLALSEHLLELIPPRPPAYPRTRETFPNQTGVTFDPIAGAQSAAELTVSLLFNSERAARLEEYHARNPQTPSLAEVIETVVKANLGGDAGPGLDNEISGSGS